MLLFLFPGPPARVGGVTRSLEGLSPVITRPWLLRIVAALCLVLGVALLYTRGDASIIRGDAQADVRPTPHLAAMMGLVVLPGATLAARRMDRRLRR